MSDEHKSQRKRILSLLLKDKFVPTYRLREFAYQYNARIYELRKQGHIINSVREKGVCGFELTGSRLIWN